MSSTVPAAVRSRQRLTYLTDAGIAIIILAVVVQFASLFASLFVALAGILIAAYGSLKLRRSINAADIHPEALDEYELQRLAEARNDGLRAALMASIGLLIVTGLIAVGARLTDFMDGVFVAHIYFKLICAQLAFVPFTVTRSLAGKINRDELISSE